MFQRARNPKNQKFDLQHPSSEWAKWSYLRSRGERDGKSISCHLVQLQKFLFLFFIFHILFDFFFAMECTTWDPYIWDLPDCNLFDNNDEIHLFSSSVQGVIKDLESFLLVSHIVSVGKRFRVMEKATLNEFSLFLSRSLSIFLKYTPLLALSGTRVTFFCPEIRGGISPSPQLYSTTRFTTQLNSFLD